MVGGINTTMVKKMVAGEEWSVLRNLAFASGGHSCVNQLPGNAGG